MARPRNADGQRTRQAILDAALDLFGEKGFFGTTLRDVAARGRRPRKRPLQLLSQQGRPLRGADHRRPGHEVERLSAALDGPRAAARCSSGWRGCPRGLRLAAAAAVLPDPDVRRPPPGPGGPLEPRRSHGQRSRPVREAMQRSSIAAGCGRRPRPAGAQLLGALCCSGATCWPSKPTCRCSAIRRLRPAARRPFPSRRGGRSSCARARVPRPRTARRAGQGAASVCHSTNLNRHDLADTSSRRSICSRSPSPPRRAGRRLRPPGNRRHCRRR